MLLQLPLDVSILALVWGLRKRSLATWPILTLLDKRSAREIDLLAHYLGRQVDGILRTEEKGVREGLFHEDDAALQKCDVCSWSRLGGN